MSEETINRLRNVFKNESRAETPEVERISRTHSYEEDLLTAVVILGIIVLALILIIIYGYCKYVKGGMEGKRNDARECTEDHVGQLEPVPEVLEIPQEPVKTRKRSMTFTQNDEECRKYREDLAVAYDSDRSRKKSTVTFAGINDINDN